MLEQCCGHPRPAAPDGVVAGRPDLRSQQDTRVAGEPGGLLMTVEQVAVLWFGEVGDRGSASSNCQKIRRLIPDALPARRIGNRWYVNRAVAESWILQSDDASVMAHPDTRATRERLSTPRSTPVRAAS
jgi:hypothetical protein